MHSHSAVAVSFTCLALMLTSSVSLAQPPTADPSAPGSNGASEPAPPSQTPAQLGEYLAAAANCVSCHTRPGGQPFAGGREFETPFGKIYSTNITADKQTGIGSWSAGDLRRAMHEGISPNGHLFPAFPYTSFTRVTDADVDAIYAYLRTIKAVRYSAPKNDIAFSMRWPLRVWNLMFFNADRFKPDTAQSDQWNRGAYLVEALGHCSACHTPRNMFMAEDARRSYAGGVIQDRVADGKNRRWSAVNLSSSKSGLASWSLTDLTKYLQTGFSPRAGSFGPMNEVILNSLRHLTNEDIKAMAVYLKSLPPRDHTGPTVTAEQAQQGAGIYKDRCEKCHSESGRGGLFSGPPVAGSAVVLAEDPASLINIILYAPETSKDIKTGAWETMPSYKDILTDAQVASVANYLRGSWNNHAPAVSEKEVAAQR